MSPHKKAPLDPPDFLYGTAWKEEQTESLTHLAISTGFRGVDTANQRKHYFEEAVGKGISTALNQGVCTREELFVQTKFTSQPGQDHRLPYDPGAALAIQVQQSFQSSLEHLRTDYLDSYVLHGPSSSWGWTSADWEVWQAMESIHDSGQVHHLGVSNVSAPQLRELLGGARIRPSFVQNRCYARFGWDEEVLTLCRQSGARYQGFSLLTANRAEIARPEISALAERHGATAAQVVFAFARQMDMLPLTGTRSQAHMRQDLESRNVTLDPAELKVVAEVGLGS